MTALSALGRSSAAQHAETQAVLSSLVAQRNTTDIEAAPPAVPVTPVVPAEIRDLLIAAAALQSRLNERRPAMNSWQTLPSTGLPGSCESSWQKRWPKPNGVSRSKAARELASIPRACGRKGGPTISAGA